MVFESTQPLAILYKSELDIKAVASQSWDALHIKNGDILCDQQVTLSHTLSLHGLGGLEQFDLFAPPHVKAGIQGKGISLTVPARIVHPGDMYINMESSLLEWDVLYNEHKVGVATLQGTRLELKPGVNDVILDVLYHPETPDAERAGNELLGRFATGETSNIRVRGKETPSGWKTPLDVSTMLRGLPISLIGNNTLHLIRRWCQIYNS
jgi:hypothetical protein